MLTTNFEKLVVFMQVYPPLPSRPRPLSYTPLTPSTTSGSFPSKLYGLVPWSFT